MAVTGIDGLISGMNTSDIIDSMITADRQSVVQLERKQELFSARQEAVQALNLRMLGADLALTKLKRASTFEAKQTASSDESVLSGTAFARAAAGTYDLEVKQLAQAHQIATTNGVSSKESPNFQGTISVTVGDQTTDVEFTELTSLQDVVDGINAAGAGVSATIVNAGTSDTPNYRVLMQSESTGAANTVSVTTDDTDGISGSGLDQLFADTDELRAAQDSLVELTVGDAASGNQFVVSGSSDTNQVEDIVDGLTVTANKVGTASLTVAFDTEPAKEAITEFVTEFNSALEYHRDNASYDEAEEEAGILFSESDIRFALDAVKQTFINGSVDGDGSIKTLSAIGITLNENNGYFELDEDVLDQVLAADPQGVSDLFIRDGLGQRMDDKMSVLTESVDGLLATKDSSLSTQIQGLSERITDMDARLEQRRQRYEAQFLNMEKLMAQFQTQEQFLTGQIEAFANMAAGSAGKK